MHESRSAPSGLDDQPNSEAFGAAVADIKRRSSRLCIGQDLGQRAVLFEIGRGSARF
jgi:hypothetical protein